MPKVPLGFSAVPYDLFKEERINWHTCDLRPGDWIRYESWGHPMPVIKVELPGPQPELAGSCWFTVVNMSRVVTRLGGPSDSGRAYYRYPVMAAWIDFVDLMREYESEEW